MKKNFATKTQRHEDEKKLKVLLSAFVAIYSGLSGLGYLGNKTLNLEP
jgi:hypothetical protein